MVKFFRILKVFFFISILSLNFLCFVHSEYLLNSEQIVNAACSEFNSLPGFLSVYSKRNIQGSLFELESALYVQSKGENILWFDLDINLVRINGFSNADYWNTIVPCGEREFFNINTTEFDLGTRDFVVECKSSVKSRCRLHQFRKERNVLKWMNMVNLEMQQGLLKMEISFSSGNFAVLTINGLSTLQKDISILSVWIKRNINSNDIKLEKFRCLNEWKKIIKLLTGKQLIIFFKNKVNDKLHRKLEKENFEYVDNVSWDFCWLSYITNEQALISC